MYTVATCCQTQAKAVKEDSLLLFASLYGRPYGSSSREASRRGTFCAPLCGNEFYILLFCSVYLFVSLFDGRERFELSLRGVLVSRMFASSVLR